MSSQFHRVSKSSETSESITKLVLNLFEISDSSFPHSVPLVGQHSGAGETKYRQYTILSSYSGRSPSRRSQRHRYRYSH